MTLARSVAEVLADHVTSNASGAEHEQTCDKTNGNSSHTETVACVWAVSPRYPITTVSPRQMVYSRVPSAEDPQVTSTGAVRG